jgi:tetratricopeptide (TPR) repeat protein
MPPAEERRQRLEKNISEAFELIFALEKDLIDAGDEVAKHRINRQIEEKRKLIKEWEAELNGFIRAATTSPALPGAVVNQFLAQLGQYEAHEDWDSAIEVGEHILTLKPNHQQARVKTANAYYQHGLNYYAEKDYDLALEDFTRAVELRPSRAEYSYECSRCHKALKNDTAYRQALQKAAALGHSQAQAELESFDLLRELDNPGTTHQRRRDIGDHLSIIGDTRRGVGVNINSVPDIEWLLVAPSGQLTLETDDKQQTFNVQPFYISKYLITYAQYDAFVQASDGYNNPTWWRGMPKEYQPQKLDNHFTKAGNYMSHPEF